MLSTASSNKTSSSKMPHYLINYYFLRFICDQYLLFIHILFHFFQKLCQPHKLKTIEYNINNTRLAGFKVFTVEK